MGFARTKFSGLDGHTRVRYTLEGGSGFYVEASPFRIALNGQTEFTKESELHEYAKAISDAWNEFRKLQENFRKKLSGH